MRKSGLTGDEAYALSKRRGTTGDLGPLKKEIGELKEDLGELQNAFLLKPYNLFNVNYVGTETVNDTVYTYVNGVIEGLTLDTPSGSIKVQSDRWISYPVEVDGGKTIYLKQGSAQNLYNVVYIHSYDKDMNHIGVNTIFTGSYDLPQNAKFVRLLMQANSFAPYKATICYDNVVGTEYQAYFNPYYADIEARQKADTALNNANEALLQVESKQNLITNGIECVIPSIIPCVVGHEMNIYAENLMRGVNRTIPTLYLRRPNSDGYTQLKDRLIVNRSAAHTATGNVYWNDGTGQKEKAFTIKCVNPKASGSISILTIGDSKVEIGHTISKTLYELFSADGVTCNLLGTNGTTYKDEGHSGWSAKEYARNATFGAGNTPNKFWNPSTNKFDFSYYMNQQGYSSVDVVNFNVGTNDMGRVTSGEVTEEQIIGYYEEIVASIKAYNPNVIVCIGLMESTNAYWTNNTTSKPLNEYYFDHRVQLIEKFDNRQSENIFLTPLYVSMDLVEDFDYTEVPLTARDTIKKRKMPNDRVHQNVVGFQKNADTIYATIQYALSLQ